MNRLQSELLRLYLPGPAALAEDDAARSALIDPQDGVRAMVLELRAPASWDVLGGVWQGVQTELALPAPAIAVSGTDGLQLWFSLAEPIGVPQAHGFLESLRRRFLADIAPGRIRLMPAPGASASQPALHARSVPALQEGTGNWSAFVSPDLAAVFAETPWLDLPPGEEGQASLLRGVSVMKAAAFEAASTLLAAAAPEPLGSADGTTGDAASQARPLAFDAANTDDPRRFLLRVMNDDRVALGLRIEAAKALLPQPPTRETG